MSLAVPVPMWLRSGLALVLAACAAPLSPLENRGAVARARETNAAITAESKVTTARDRAPAEDAPEPTRGVCPKATAPTSMGRVRRRTSRRRRHRRERAKPRRVLDPQRLRRHRPRIRALEDRRAPRDALVRQRCPRRPRGIAIEDGPDGSFLYFADIGDNDAARGEIVIRRVAEPRLGGAFAELEATAETIRVTYGDGPHNAETLLFDPTTRELFLATKEANVVNHRIGAFVPDAIVTTTQIAEVLLALATGGDVSRDGKIVALRNGGSEALLWMRGPEEDLAAVFARNPRRVPVANDEQAEAFAFLPGNDGYVTIAEGKKPSLDIARFE